MIIKYADISVQGYKGHAKDRNTDVGIKKDWKECTSAEIKNVILIDICRYFSKCVIQKYNTIPEWPTT